MDHRKIRNLQYVRRFNFHSCIRYQNVAEHSYFVALYAREIAWRFFGGFTRDVQAMLVMATVDAAMNHDAAEAITGDLPYLVRREMDKQELRRLEKMAEKELGIDSNRFVKTLRGEVPTDALTESVALIVEMADAIDLKFYLQEERHRGNDNLAKIEGETFQRIISLSERLGQLPPGTLWTALEEVDPEDLPEEMSH